MNIHLEIVSHVKNGTNLDCTRDQIKVITSLNPNACFKLLCVFFLRSENQKLNFLKFNQPSFIRSETLNALQETTGEDIPENLGKPIILSHTHPGSPRNMRENFRDSMAIGGSEGQPSLFLTFTANPAWAEVKHHLDDNELPQDRLDLINKVFALKLDEFMKDVQKGVFGHCKSTILVTEFQSRGSYFTIILTFIIYHQF